MLAEGAYRHLGAEVPKSLNQMDLLTLDEEVQINE
jgi:hypothetical protein